MLRTILAVAALATATMLAACGTETVYGVGVDDAGSSDAAPSTTSGSSGSSGSPSTPATCTAMTQLGVGQSVVSSREARPAPQGGTVESGTYVLTEVTSYGSTQQEGAVVGSAAAITLRIAGGAYEIISSGSGVLLRSSGKLTTSDTTLTFDASCVSPSAPDRGLPGPESVGYTATATTVALHTDTGGDSILRTFTKR